MVTLGERVIREPRESNPPQGHSDTPGRRVAYGETVKTSPIPARSRNWARAFRCKVTAPLASPEALGPPSPFAERVGLFFVFASPEPLASPEALGPPSPFAERVGLFCFTVYRLESPLT